MKIAFPAALFFFSTALLISADPRLTREVTARLVENWTICSSQQLAEQVVSYSSERTEETRKSISEQGLGVQAAKGTRVKIVGGVPGYSQVQILEGPSAGYVGWIFTEVLERHSE